MFHLTYFFPKINFAEIVTVRVFSFFSEKFICLTLCIAHALATVETITAGR